MRDNCPPVSRWCQPQGVGERLVEVVDCKRDVPVAGAEVVGAAVVGRSLLALAVRPHKRVVTGVRAADRGDLRREVWIDRRPG
jgi:hypothetical protein